MTEGADRGREERAASEMLQEAWRHHVSSEPALLDGLVRRHREHHRRYHRIDHVESVIRCTEELAAVEAVEDLGGVVAAAFYHDAIYEPTHPANERASARLARRDLSALGWEDDRIGAVSAMIEGTATHSGPPDIDTAVLFDADLCILGADPGGYADYVAKVRAEYKHVDDDEWRSGRAAVLQGFLDRERIFATPTAITRWEESARTNITAELGGLTS